MYNFLVNRKTEQLVENTLPSLVSLHWAPLAQVSVAHQQVSQIGRQGEVKESEDHLEVDKVNI